LGQARSKQNPNLAKFSQIEPSLGKEFPRKRLGFPWISYVRFEAFQRLARTP
jgi:hypothetical protein